MGTRRAFLLQTAAAAQPAPKPNVVVLIAGQWRAQALPSAGDRQFEAPNLGRLAAEGIHFERAYASSPHSAPSHASLITGRFPHSCRVIRNESRLPENEASMARALSEAGYATAYIGRWRLDAGEPGVARRAGFAEFRIDANAGAPEPVARLAAEFIHQSRRRPFCLFVSWERSAGKPMAEGAAEDRRVTVNDNVPLKAMDEARLELAGYYAYGAGLDRGVGQVLAALDQEGLAGDTITVFTSDHGTLAGAHGLFDSEGEPYEECARVPLLMRFPRLLAAGSRNAALVSNVDVAPTLLSLCGVAAPAGMQGRDLAPLIRGAGELPDSIFAEGRMGTEQEWRMMVRGFDKLVIDRAGEVTHLYNLAADPQEMSNQASSRAERRRKDELTALLEVWRRRTGDGRSASGLRERKK